jgi:ABC-type transport system, involved in lipoprotein release, permease component
MGILARKLTHFIRRNLGQFLAAVAVVALGIMVYVSMNTAYSNLSQSQTQLYQDNHFADYYFQTVKAPQEVVKQIEKVPGIKMTTGRIQTDLAIIKTNDERATARLISYTLPVQNQVNGIVVEKGRMFSSNQNGSSIEVLVDPQFASANHINWGDSTAVVVNGRERFLTVVGTGSGPEFVYPLKDAADILPDPLKFGIFMVETGQAQQLLNMEGQINQVLLQFSPGADQTQVIAAVHDILQPYGLIGSYPRKNQISHAVLQAKLDGIHSVAVYLPIIFLAMAVVIQLIILRRMVKTQRTQIGVMKALGYDNAQIMLHYTWYSLAVSMLGAIMGTVLGVMMAGAISNLYNQYFNLPGGLQPLNIRILVNSLLLSLGIGIAAGLSGSWGVVRINPAEAMRPEPPRNGNRILLEKWPGLWGRIAPVWKMTLRSIGRNPGRFFITMLGVIFSIGLLIIAFFYNDAVDYMMQKTFNEGERYDITVRFNSPLPESELLYISRMDGVQKVEPFMEMPVKIHFRDGTEDEILLAYPAGLSMKRLEDEKGNPISVPPDGIVLNQRTAKKLGAGKGDNVEVETQLPIGPIHYESVKIVGETQQLFGGGSYINLDQANNILQESHLISGAMIRVDSGQESQVESQLDKMLGISSILGRQKEIQIFQNDMSVVTSAISIMIFFAVVLGFAIIYNASVINLAERRREMASLRVMGFSVKEISSMLFKENLILLAAGILFGLPFGRILVKSYVESVSTDQFTLPVVIYPRTYLFAAIGGIIFVMVAYRFAVSGIKRLDMVAALKNTD